METHRLFLNIYNKNSQVFSGHLFFFNVKCRDQHRITFLFLSANLEKQTSQPRNAFMRDFYFMFDKTLCVLKKQNQLFMGGFVCLK